MPDSASPDASALDDPTLASRHPYDPSLLEAIHDLVSELRHELGNPLNSIKAALTLLRRGVATYPIEKTLSYLDATLTEVGRLERLLLSLRRLSEPAAKAPDPFDLEPFLEVFIAQYGYEVERRSIILEVGRIGAGWVAVDPEAVAQVLLDLFNSAVQRLARVEEPRLEFSARPAGGVYSIELRSNGRAAAAGSELPFVTTLLGPRDEDYRLSLAISRQILLQMGCGVATEQPSAELWISRVDLPLVPQPTPLA